MSIPNLKLIVSIIQRKTPQALDMLAGFLCVLDQLGIGVLLPN
jgi:hypothetical protein